MRLNAPLNQSRLVYSLRHSHALKRSIYGGGGPSTEQPLIVRLVEKAPTKAKPYLMLLRIDKPIGSSLLFWPGAWSIALASCGPNRFASAVREVHDAVYVLPYNLPDLRLLSLFFVGAVIMRGAGCIVNDLWDRNLDKQVARTAGRPIASNQITSKQAIVFLASQLLLGLTVLVQLNNYSILLGMCSLPLVFIYPFMKRVTYWPQFVLGLTFNWGALLGYAAWMGSISDWHSLSIVLPLYFGGVFWTLHYDTIYALQDRLDDVKVGIKSSALALGNRPKWGLAVFALVSMALLFLAGYNDGLVILEKKSNAESTESTKKEWLDFLVHDLNHLYLWCMVCAAGHLVWQIARLKPDSVESCGHMFRANRDFGFLVFAAIVWGKNSHFLLNEAEWKARGYQVDKEILTTGSGSIGRENKE